MTPPRSRFASFALVLVGAALAIASPACEDDEGTPPPTSAGIGGAASSSSVGSGGSGPGGGGSGGAGTVSCFDTGDLPEIDPADPPQMLSDTGIYDDIVNKVVSPYANLFQPEYELWSDGAEKSRWFAIPCGSEVDTSDMDDWDLPEGMRFWKLFVRDGVMVETRLIYKYGPLRENVFFASYQWNAPGNADATLVTDPLNPLPVEDANGTPHDIPSEPMCRDCHGGGLGGVPSRLLGFSAIQLSHTLSGVTIDDLAEAGFLSVNPPAGGYHPPGTELDQETLGYLHANCAHCHNPTPEGAEPLIVGFHMQLVVGDTSLENTQAWQTGVCRPTQGAAGIASAPYRVRIGDPDSSCISVRTKCRNDDANCPDGSSQMPMLDTEIIHPAGTTRIDNWISSLSGAGGADPCEGFGGSP
jgi:hypothetical protein